MRLKKLFRDDVCLESIHLGEVRYTKHYSFDDNHLMSRLDCKDIRNEEWITALTKDNLVVPVGNNLINLLVKERNKSVYESLRREHVNWSPATIPLLN